MSFLIVLLVLAFGAFVGVLFFECAEKYISKLLGLSEKNEVLKFLGISMGGILVALQALMSYEARQGDGEVPQNAQVKATKEQAKANENTEQGQRQERLKNAIEHLGHKSDSVRIGGAYELFHLVEDAENRKVAPNGVQHSLRSYLPNDRRKRKYRETYTSRNPRQKSKAC